jgi:hypothetical protein
VTISFLRRTLVHGVIYLKQFSEWWTYYTQYLEVTKLMYLNLNYLVFCHYTLLGLKILFF